MKILFTFPGQGAQQPGMLHALPDHPETARTLAQTSAALGRDVLAEDSAAALQSTVATQLCLLTAGVAQARVLAAYGAVPDMVAGLSIGAYPAAVIAGVLDYPDAVRLVALRATLMEQGYPRGYGMLAVAGLGQARVEALVAQVHADATPVYLANLNGPMQFVLAGADGALEKVAGLALAAGAGRAERLNMRVPSHCPLLAGQARTLQAAFDDVALARPTRVYISGSTARALFDPDAIRADLALNMARQVHWIDTVRHAWERGARLALEMPSGCVLTGLTAPVFDAGSAVCSASTPLDRVLALLGEL